MSEVVLVRHGETEWTKTGQHTGTTDIDLTPVGRAQAERLGSVLDAWSFASTLTSPLRRAADTCRLAGHAGADVREDLAEWSYGAYEGRTTALIRAERPGWSLWRDGAPGGETPEQIADRVDRIIAEVRSTRGNVALFAHGHLLRVLAARWVGLPAACGALLALHPASVSVLGHERETAVIVSWNLDYASIGH